MHCRPCFKFRCRLFKPFSLLFWSCSLISCKERAWICHEITTVGLWSQCVSRTLRELRIVRDVILKSIKKLSFDGCSRTSSSMWPFDLMTIHIVPICSKWPGINLNLAAKHVKISFFLNLTIIWIIFKVYIIMILDWNATYCIISTSLSIVSGFLLAFHDIVYR